MAVSSKPLPPPSSPNENEKKGKADFFSSSDVPALVDDHRLRRRIKVTERKSSLGSDVRVKLKRGPNWIRKWHMRDYFYVTVVVFFHALSLLGPFYFTWGALWVAVILHVLTISLGITLSFHRNLSHRSFRLPKYLEYLFAYFGLLAFQGDPMFWVSTHRHHHKVTDTVRDPHSPTEGFWFSQIFWLFDFNKILDKGANYGNVGDLLKHPYYRFLQQTNVLHFYLLLALLYAFGGVPFIVWGVGVRCVFGYHITFVVNSVCHTWGHQAWNTEDLSKNNWVLSVLTFGESWHNNHHAFEFSARHGLEWWQIDLTWCMIKVLEYFGLATHIKVPSESQKQKMAFKKEAEVMEPLTEVEIYMHKLALQNEVEDLKIKYANN